MKGKRAWREGVEGGKRGGIFLADEAILRAPMIITRMMVKRRRRRKRSSGRRRT